MGHPEFSQWYSYQNNVSSRKQNRWGPRMKLRVHFLHLNYSISEEIFAVFLIKSDDLGN